MRSSENKVPLELGWAAEQACPAMRFHSDGTFVTWCVEGLAHEEIGTRPKARCRYQRLLGESPGEIRCSARACSDYFFRTGIASLHPEEGVIEFRLPLVFAHEEAGGVVEVEQDLRADVDAGLLEGVYDCLW